MTLNEQWRENRDEMLAGEFLLFGMLGKLLYNQPAQDEIAVLIEDEIFTDAPFAMKTDGRRPGNAATMGCPTRRMPAPSSRPAVDWTHSLRRRPGANCAVESVYYTKSACSSVKARWMCGLVPALWVGAG